MIALLIFFVNILLGVLFASGKFIESVNNRISFSISFQSGYTTSDIRVRTLADTLQTTFTGIAITAVGYLAMVARAMGPACCAGGTH